MERDKRQKIKRLAILPFENLTQSMERLGDVSIGIHPDILICRRAEWQREVLALTTRIECRFELANESLLERFRKLGPDGYLNALVSTILGVGRRDKEDNRVIFVVVAAADITQLARVFVSQFFHHYVEEEEMIGYTAGPVVIDASNPPNPTFCWFQGEPAEDFALVG